ncbi:1-acyl-sn-glycerol-3-phosphate acyltransferase zeta isoform 1 [Carex littledalei]|uniref:1-acyl-sn-glycerol-3-phosphate acyltransferase zeta isoform 1 n=1 Tax=Carex littledalei TaxID=544730 RepID=A0A833S0Y0_9POAL|nr:1-acyl-sn-glycerol-3-phosphate acyltransferase zeta isoform 1 [Carex littledalei]
MVASSSDSSGESCRKRRRHKDSSLKARKTNTNPEGLTTAFGNWAPEVVARLHNNSLSCKRKLVEMMCSVFVASGIGVVKYHGPRPSMRPHQDEVGMLLGFPGQSKKLDKTICDIQCVLAYA